MNTILTNILLGISLAAPLGPAAVAVIHNGLRAGFLRAFITGLGVTTADAMYMLLVSLGISRFLGNPAVRIAVGFLGAVALGYLGVKSLLEAIREVPILELVPPTARNPFLVGFLVNVSNPIAIFWWLGVFGSLVVSSRTNASGVSVFSLSTSILLGILFWHTSMSLASHVFKNLLDGRAVRIISLLAGCFLLLFAFRFGLEALTTVVRP